jgi:hypothetical protein
MKMWNNRAWYPLGPDAYEGTLKLREFHEPICFANQNCDKRCHVVVPLAQECGQHENKCTCTGKAKDFCQPEEPEHINQCYTPDKQLLESYMCGEAGAEGECRQCWQWNWKAPNCTGKYDKLVILTFFSFNNVIYPFLLKTITYYR